MEALLIRALLTVLIVSGAAGHAHAQGKPENEGWGLTVGAGGLMSPTYEGDDSYRVSVLPNIQVSYGDTFFASVQEGVGYRIINDETLRVGPIGRVKFSRSEDGDQPFAITGDDTTDLRGLSDVDTSIELGGFVELEAAGMTFSAEARQAVTGHEGFVADLGVKWSGRDFLFGPPVIWSVGPRVRLVDDAYNAAYFSVTPAQALASGLSVYEAGGGVHSYGVGATAIIPLTQDNSWAAVVFAGYDRLAGDVADSSLVQQRGAEDQATLGVFVSYRAF
jgi:outer membrane protein